MLRSVKQLDLQMIRDCLGVCYRGDYHAVSIGVLSTIAVFLILLYTTSLEMNINAKQSIHSHEINRYISQFQSSPVVDSWARISQSWRAEESRHKEINSRIETRSGDEKKIALRNYQHFTIETVNDYALAPDIEIVLHFFGRLAQCVRFGGCGPLEAAQIFGADLREFHSRFSYYFEFEGIDANADQMLSIILLP